MLKSQVRCATTLFAIVFGLLAACLGTTQAVERDASPYVMDNDIASAAPFELLRAAPHFQLSEPFGLEISAPVTGGLQNKWDSVKKKLPRERRILMRCRANAARCPPAAKRFLAIIDRAATREGWARIAEINRAINLDIRPVDDMTQYGVVDLWATPLMAFASNAGDCEDYAIAKYVALHEIGVAADDLRLVVVRDRAAHEDHAVAAVRYEGRWLILDNRTLEMRQDLGIGEFDPLFVIDSDGVKRVTARASEPKNAGENVSPAEIESQSSYAWPSAPLVL